MSNRLESLFGTRAVLCDGAMGTTLHAHGVFIDRCCDELNLSRPELVRSIHEDYLQAGAEIIVTNTFGANELRLDRYGLKDRVMEINRAGVELAAKAVSEIKKEQSGKAWVAGCIGPLGVRLEPLGKLALEQAYGAFAGQIRALAEAGVDLLMIETITALDEAEQAIHAAKEAAPGLPIFALVTVGEDANCLDGSSPASAAARLAQWGADAIGCNCSTGPATVLTAVERMAQAGRLPLVAMPSAGMPRTVDGGSLYPCSPESMASYARNFRQVGVQFIGGCCGSTPDHIRAMKSAVKSCDLTRS